MTSKIDLNFVSNTEKKIISMNFENTIKYLVKIIKSICHSF